MKRDIKVLNPQVLLEIICQLTFGGTLVYLMAGERYLQYVAPRMKLYLYFTAGLMAVWALTGIGRLFRPKYKIHMAHCFLLVIPTLIALFCHTPQNTAVLNTAGEIPQPLINKTEYREEELAVGEQGNTLPGLNLVDKKIIVSDDLFGMWYSELYMNMEVYDGYTIVITGSVLKDSEYDAEDEFAVARLAMTCCIADVAPVGFPCSFSGGAKLTEDSWVTVEGKLMADYIETDGHKYANPRIEAERVTPADRVEGYVYPY